MDDGISARNSVPQEPHSRHRSLSQEQHRQRAKSSPHQLYLDTLQVPTADRIHAITAIQQENERIVESRYHIERQPTREEEAAATVIQSAFRGYRQRRQLNGHTLDPTQRWTEAIREMRFRAVSAPHQRPNVDDLLRQRRARQSSTATATRDNWTRVAEIARHAGGSPDPVTGTHTRQSSTASTADSQAALLRPMSGMLLDSRYFLEMTDLKHRYGANLQVYHEQWLRSDTDQNFFYWLDHGDGKDVQLPGCTRAKLEKERIRYLSREERQDYLVNVDDDGKLRWAKNDQLVSTSAEEYRDSMHGIVRRDSEDPQYNDSPVLRKQNEDIAFGEALAAITRLKSPERAALSDDSDNLSSISSDSGLSPANAAELPLTKSKEKYKKRIFVSPATMLNNLLRATVKPGTWIYVMDTTGRLYVGIKSSGAFQHASFLSGSRIASAGSIRIEQGQLTYLAPLSGHYRPTTKSFRHFVRQLKSENVDVSKLKVSGSYAILLAMEWYGKSRADVLKIVKHDKEYKKQKKRDKHGRVVSPGPETKVVDALHDHSAMDATDIIQQSFNTEHEKHSLKRMMKDLRLKRIAKLVEKGD